MKKILFITLSNIGDAVLTTPVLQGLLNRSDQPDVSVLVGPKAAELFQRDPAIREVIVYDKHDGWREKLKLLRMFRAKRFDEVVDLRNTVFPLLLLGWKGLFSMLKLNRKRGAVHAVEDHLRRAFGDAQDARFRVFIPQEAQQRAEQFLKDSQGPWIGVAPGAASDLKRWPSERFAEIAQRIHCAGYGRVVLLGEAKDRMDVPGSLNLIGRTSLLDLAAVLKCCSLLLTNDSGPMHLAAAVGTPVVAIFGPSDARQYGPFGQGHRIVRLDLSCSPCGQAQCPLGTHACMKDLDVEKVWASVASVIESSHAKAL